MSVSDSVNDSTPSQREQISREPSFYPGFAREHRAAKRLFPESTSARVIGLSWIPESLAWS